VHVGVNRLLVELEGVLDRGLRLLEKRDGDFIVGFPDSIDAFLSLTLFHWFTPGMPRRLRASFVFSEGVPSLFLAFWSICSIFARVRRLLLTFRFLPMLELQSCLALSDQLLAMLISHLESDRPVPEVRLETEDGIAVVHENSRVVGHSFRILIDSDMIFLTPSSY
jgi:hypothetical protein